MKDLRILCFGASLVEGFTQGGFRYTPFSVSMSRKLREKWPQMKLDIDVNGMSGDMVTGGYKGRMERAYSNSSPPKTSTPSRPSTPTAPLYNFTIFLGGTNDLGWGKPASEIWTSIKAITAIPLLHGSKVLLMTVPECGVVNEALDKKRNDLNACIKQDERAGVYTFDLHAAIPYHSMPEWEREEIWDDGLHFTPKGYERMGELIAARLVEILEAESGDEVTKGGK